MSVSSLPEWKQLLLERKRREEEAREQREKQEEQKLANMPAWKRGIIQRRKAKQDGPGEACPIEARSPSDGLSDTDSSVTVNLGSDLSTSPDPAMWLDGDPKYGSQVSLETIVPVNENPFIRIQKRKGRDSELCSPKSYDEEAGRGKDFEIKMETFRDLSEGRDKEQSSKQTEASWSVPKEKDRYLKRQDKEFSKVKKDEEYRDSDSPSPSFSPTAPYLRTIRADNIIIIEQERKSNDDRRGRWMESERCEEDTQSKRALKMDLKEILAGGGSVTEIRASEVLIIQPPEMKTKEEVDKIDGKGREGREGRELRADMSWLKEKAKESVKEKERPWGQATVIKEDKKDNSDDCVFVERGGRVSQLLCKFGEHRKPPSRSKSSENLNPPQNLGDEAEEDEREVRSAQLKGVPKRSLSFSDRVFSTKENGNEEEVRMRERIHSEKEYWTEVASLGRDNVTKTKMGCARLLEKDRCGRHRHWQTKEKQNRNIVDGDEGFTIASVKNVEGISFAKRVPIRKEGRAREKNYGVEKGVKFEGQNYECKIQGANLRDATYRHESACRESSGLLCTVPDNSNRHRLASSEIGTVLSQQNNYNIGDSNVSSIQESKNSEGTFPSSLDAKKSTMISTLGAQPASLKIQIPRTVFYVAEEMFDEKKPSGVQDWDSEKEGEKSECFEAGKPVSRVESLKDKIRQQVIENTKQKDAKDKADFEVAVVCETAATTTMADAEIEQEVESQIRQSDTEVEKEVATSTSEHAADVTQEVSVAKDCPQLPDSKSEVEEGEEVDCGGEINTESTRPESDGEEENVQNDQVNEEEFLEDDRQFSEEDLKELTGNFESEESISPSPPDSNSLEAMSRIYNLETVGSRSGLCLRDRTSDMSSVHLIKIKPLGSQQHGEGIKSIQRQIENFKLKEQEVIKPQLCSPQNSKVQHSPKRKTLKEDTTNKQDAILSPQMSPKRVNSPDQSIEINASILRCQSPENSLKILDLAPTPVSSPCSPSPAQSPNNSPAPSPTPTTLFTIKSASGGQVKRGATITITPKKTQVQASSPTTRTTSPTSNTSAPVNEPAKKKYPTVEEIEVIGGYLNLDKSCLVKNRGKSKKVKVCFSEERLEQLCEYPSETSMWAGSPYPLDLDWTDPDPDQDEEVHAETALLKTTRSIGTAMGRGLRVGQCHPLLKKHSV